MMLINPNFFTKASLIEIIPWHKIPRQGDFYYTEPYIPYRFSRTA